MLTSIWETSRDRKIKKGKEVEVIERRAVAFRNALQAFFSSCLSYVFTEVDIIWEEYIEKMGESATVFEMVS